MSYGAINKIDFLTSDQMWRLTQNPDTEETKAG